jgi:hypothetical protein
MEKNSKKSQKSVIRKSREDYLIMLLDKSLKTLSTMFCQWGIHKTIDRLSSEILSFKGAKFTRQKLILLEEATSTANCVFLQYQLHYCIIPNQFFSPLITFLEKLISIFPQKKVNIPSINEKNNVDRQDPLCPQGNTIIDLAIFKPTLEPRPAKSKFKEELSSHNVNKALQQLLSTIKHVETLIKNYYSMFFCPLSHTMIMHPIRLLQNNTVYEEKYIKEWVDSHDCLPNKNNPILNKTFEEANDYDELCKKYRKEILDIKTVFFQKANKLKISLTNASINSFDKKISDLFNQMKSLKI